MEYLGKYKFSSPSVVDSDLVGHGQGLETVIYKTNKQTNKSLQNKTTPSPHDSHNQEYLGNTEIRKAYSLDEK